MAGTKPGHDEKRVMFQVFRSAMKSWLHLCRASSRGVSKDEAAYSETK
jgi:hypothetical protein